MDRNPMTFSLASYFIGIYFFYNLDLKRFYAIFI